MTTKFVYNNITSNVLKDIIMGTLNIGDRVQSEHELMTNYQVSRNTARRALAEIEEYGLIKRIQGKGSFVTDNKIQQDLLTVKSMTELFANNKKVTYSKVISAELTMPSQRVKQHLQIQNDDEVVRIYRLRYSERLPVALNETFFRKDDFGFLLNKNLENMSLYKLIFYNCDLTIGREEKELEMIPLRAEEAEMLNQNDGDSAFLLKAKAWDQNGKTFSYNNTIYRGDKIKFAYTFIS